MWFVDGMQALVVTWSPGGNLPPMLAASEGLAGRGHEVTVMASGATRAEAERLGVPLLGFARTPDPDVTITFESQAQVATATAAGEEIARDTRDAIEEIRPDGGWTTDLRTLAATYRMLGLAPFEDSVAAWEASDLVLVTAPRWLDVDAAAPEHVVHAGPLGVRPRRASRRDRALLISAARSWTASRS
jgi:hypothetical protein